MNDQGDFGEETTRLLGKDMTRIKKTKFKPTKCKSTKMRSFGQRDG